MTSVGDGGDDGAGGEEQGALHQPKEVVVHEDAQLNAKHQNDVRPAGGTVRLDELGQI